MPTRPQRSDRYEAQLTEGELQALHVDLLDAKKSLEAIRDGLPPWRTGTKTGRKPSLATLSNIRDRIAMEEAFRENEATTETLLEELKREVPDITEAQLDEMGHKAFTLLAIRQQDAKSFVQLRSARTKAEIERSKLALREREVNRADQALALDRKRFQRETCELFVEWSADQRAKDIAAAPITNAAKIEQLGQLMFGDDWAAGGLAGEP